MYWKLEAPFTGILNNGIIFISIADVQHLKCHSHLKQSKPFENHIEINAREEVEIIRDNKTRINNRETIYLRSFSYHHLKSLMKEYLGCLFLI